MHANQTRRFAAIALALLAGLFVPGTAAGQDPAQPAAPAQSRPNAGQRLALEVFGGAGINWPSATSSFEAVDLDPRPVEFGGGARVAGIWRDLFAQVSGGRWSETGERTFIDSTGTRFPLGIPLNVKATYVDVSVGWKSGFRTRSGGTALWSYVGTGVGAAMYSEDSPFAEPGEDLDTRSLSYHVLAGVEIPLFKGLALAVDARYRYVPDVLGEDGVSAVLGEDALGGLQTSAGLRLGFGGRSSSRVQEPPRRPFVAEPRKEPKALPTVEELDAGVILETAPVFLLPDSTRTPLRMLPPGTPVTVLEQNETWIRVQFYDPQLGLRFGYIERKFVRIRKQEARAPDGAFSATTRTG